MLANRVRSKITVRNFKEMENLEGISYTFFLVLMKSTPPIANTVAPITCKPIANDVDVMGLIGIDVDVGVGVGVLLEDAKKP